MRTRITLECTECKQRNYNTTKDKKSHPDRVERSTASSVRDTQCIKKQNSQFYIMEGLRWEKHLTSQRAL